MKWYKRDTDAWRSEKITYIRQKWGRDWSDRWSQILEMVAEKMDGTDRCHLKLPISEWCKQLDCTAKKLRSFLQDTAETLSTRHEEDAGTLVIYIPNLLKKRDEYSEKSRHESGQTPSQRKSKEKETDTEPEAPRASGARERAKTASGPSGFLPSVASGQKPEKNGNWQPPPEIILLANDLLGAAGIGDKQDRKDIAYGVLHAVKAGNEDQIHRLISELKAGEFSNANNLTAVLRARLKALRE